MGLYLPISMVLFAAAATAGADLIHLRSSVPVTGLLDPDPASVPPRAIGVLSEFKVVPRLLEEVLATRVMAYKAAATSA